MGNISFKVSFDIGFDKHLNNHLNYHLDNSYFNHDNRTLIDSLKQELDEKNKKIVHLEEILKDTKEQLNKESSKSSNQDLLLECKEVFKNLNKGNKEESVEYIKEIESEDSDVEELLEKEDVKPKKVLKSKKVKKVRK